MAILLMIPLKFVIIVTAVNLILVEKVNTSCNFCDQGEIKMDACDPRDEFENEFPEASCASADGGAPLCKVTRITACTPNVFGRPGNQAQRYYKFGCAERSELVEGRPMSCYWERNRTARDIVVKDVPGKYIIAPSFIIRTCYCEGANCNGKLACDCGPTCNDFSSNSCTDPDNCDCLKNADHKCGTHPDVFIMDNTTVIKSRH